MTAPRSRSSPTLRSLSSLQAAAGFPERLRVGDILAFPGFKGSVVVAGAGGLSRDLEQVNVMQVPTDRYAKKNELILSAATAFEAFAGKADALVTALASKGVAALAVRGTPAIACLGPLALGVADRESLPIMELPSAAHLNDLQAEVLERIVAWQSRQLRIAEAVRDQLSGHVLVGVELESLPQAVAEVIGGDVLLFDGEGSLIATSGGGVRRATRGVRGWLAEDRRDPVSFDDSWVIWPCLASTRRLGCLVARVGPPPRPVHLAALEHGATIAALKILQRQEAAEASSRLATGFVRDLLSGSLDEASALRRATAAGWEPESDYWTILTTRPQSGLPKIASTLRHLVPEALVTERAEECLAVVAAEEFEAEGDAALDRVLELAENISAIHGDVFVGISSRHREVGSLPMAVEEANEALRVARIFARRTRVRAYDSVGLLRLLLDVPVEELHDFPASVLGPVDRLASPYRESLMSTLELLVVCGLNVAETSRRGGWHYNTVRSRATRLTELLGPFTHDGARLDAVTLALRLRQELAPVGD